MKDPFETSLGWYYEDPSGDVVGPYSTYQYAKQQMIADYKNSCPPCPTCED